MITSGNNPHVFKVTDVPRESTTVSSHYFMTRRFLPPAWMRPISCCFKVGSAARLRSRKEEEILVENQALCFWQDNPHKCADIATKETFRTNHLNVVKWPNQSPGQTPK
uniref:Uncharacterized protein n=1 Tax=Cyprinodon variegatus TaxID=28743 RepID=A0A3Q2DP82_CYPVA